MPITLKIGFEQFLGIKPGQSCQKIGPALYPAFSLCTVGSGLSRIANMSSSKSQPLYYEACTLPLCFATVAFQVGAWNEKLP